jgi:hypothetical protein
MTRRSHVAALRSRREPADASFEFNLDDKSACPAPQSQDNISLSSLPDDVLDSLQDADKLLVCELSIEDNDKDTQIVYAYEAEINS